MAMTASSSAAGEAAGGAEHVVGQVAESRTRRRPTGRGPPGPVPRCRSSSSRLQRASSRLRRGSVRPRAAIEAGEDAGGGRVAQQQPVRASGSPRRRRPRWRQGGIGQSSRRPCEIATRRRSSARAGNDEARDRRIAGPSSRYAAAERRIGTVDTEPTGYALRRGEPPTDCACASWTPSSAISTATSRVSSRRSPTPRTPAPTSRSSPSWSSPATRRRTCCSSPASSPTTCVRSAKVAAASGRCAAVVGFVDEDGDLYNAAAVCAFGKVHGIYHKQQLPNYGVFDEQRYFAPGGARPSSCRSAGCGSACRSARTPGARPGPIAAPGRRRRRAGRQHQRLAVLRAACSPSAERMLATRAADASCTLVYVNLVGGQDELVFDGGSMVFDPDGDPRGRRAAVRGGWLVVDLDVRPVFRKRLLDPAGPRRRRRPLPCVTVTERRRGRRRASRSTASAAPRPSQRLEPSRGGLRGAGPRHPRLRREERLRRGASSASPAASTRRSSPRSPPTPSGRSGSTAWRCRRGTPSHGSVDDAAALAGNLGIELRTIPIEPVHAAFARACSAPVFDGAGRGPHRGEPPEPHPRRHR